MIFQQIVNEESGCLSYLIGCGQAGRAIVVDPGRDRVHEYLRLARRRGLKITHVVETHTHADHISGNRDLAAATSAAIFVHAAAGLAFDHERLSDGARAAAATYETLTRVLLPLDDSVEVYPAHGAGSACGRAMSAKAGSTIGFERRFNPALQLRDRAAFVDFIMQDLPPKPPQFEK